MRREETEKIRILHIITGLNVGGAEISLCKLVENIDRERFDSMVISMLPDGPLAERIKKAGVPVHSLEMSREAGFLGASRELRSLISEFKPDLIQTWMYHADLFGGIAGRLSGVPVVWNIRHSNMDPRVNRKRTVWITKICALLSRTVPAKIVCCAHRAMDVHSEIGYDAQKMLVIPNGFDLSVFKRDEATAHAIRNAAGISGDAYVVGMVARFDPQKGFCDFFKAAVEIAEKKGGVRFVLCGSGVDEDNRELDAMMNDDMRVAAALLGRRDDVPGILSAVDVYVMSSVAGEGFPNVVGEAMACETPCVVTDVGDAARIVGDDGIVVAPGDCRAIAAGVLKLLDLSPAERTELGRRARKRIAYNYELKHTVKMYEGLYESLVLS